MGETFDRSLNRENRIKIIVDIPETAEKTKKQRKERCQV